MTLLNVASLMLVVKLSHAFVLHPSRTNTLSSINVSPVVPLANPFLHDPSSSCHSSTFSRLYVAEEESDETAETPAVEEEEEEVVVVEEPVVAEVAATSITTDEDPNKVTMLDLLDVTMSSSRFIYSFAELRKAVRAKPTDWIDPETILSDDIIFIKDVETFVDTNEESIAKGPGLMPDLIALMKEEDETTGSLSDTDYRIRCCDAKNDQEELVYGIFVDRSKNKVIVAFRGTNTLRDIIADLDIRKYEVLDEEETYTVHYGFRKYLKAKTIEQEGSDELISKFRVITDQLAEVMQDCEGFDVVSTGHSLGGSLSTFYGMKLAEEGTYPVVNVVSYASPYVGTDSFRTAFRQKEREGRIRHIRVSNPNDCIPANPCIGGFKHVGVNLKLRPTNTPIMEYEGVENPPLPITFIIFLTGFLSVLCKVLPIIFAILSIFPVIGGLFSFIGTILSILPTIPILPAAAIAFLATNVLLTSHGLDSYRTGLNNGKGVTPFYTKRMAVLYEKRMEELNNDLS